MKIHSIIISRCAKVSVIYKNYSIYIYDIPYFQTAMDQLHMHFTSAIHNTAFQIVLGYVELCSGTGRENFHKRQYTDLCKVRILWLLM